MPMGVEPGEFSEELVTPELRSGNNTGALQWSPCSKGNGIVEGLNKKAKVISHRA